MDFLTIVGFIGAAIILLAFYMNQTHRWKDTDVAYDLANLCGGVLLIYFSVMTAAWPFVLLNGVWTLLSLRDLITRR